MCNESDGSSRAGEVMMFARLASPKVLAVLALMGISFTVPAPGRELLFEDGFADGALYPWRAYSGAWREHDGIADAVGDPAGTLCLGSPIGTRGATWEVDSAAVRVNCFSGGLRGIRISSSALGGNGVGINLKVGSPNGVDLWDGENFHWYPFNHQYGVWYTLKLVVRQTTFAAWVDGTFIGELPLRGGTEAHGFDDLCLLVHWSSRAYYDDVRVFGSGNLLSSPENLVINGSFEQGPDPGQYHLNLPIDSHELAGWTVIRNGVDYIGNYWEASDGDRSLDLDGAAHSPGGVSQSVETTLGHTYLLSFDLAGNPDGQPTIKQVRIEAASQANDYSFDVTGKSHDSMGWTRKEWTFVAMAPITDVQFYSLDPLDPGAWGPAIDNVALIDLGPAYEILSATFDKSVYQNGVDTAHLTVVTRSNWGSSPSLTLQVSTESNLGDQFDLGSDVFALAPGGDHTSQFSWPMPAADHPWEFDLGLVVSDENRSVIISDVVNGACSGMVINQDELETFEGELAESQCLPPGSACDYAMAGAIPHIGAPMAIVAFVDAGCQMGERLRAGNYLGAGVAAIGGLIGGISLVLDFLPGSEPVDAIAGAVSVGVTCADDLWLSDLYPARGADFRSGGEIDSIAAQVLAVFPIVGRDFSAEVFLKGSATLRVGIDSSWTSLDTLGLTETAIFGERDSLQWGHVGIGPHQIGELAENPHSAFDVEFRVTAPDTLEFGFLHRDEAGEVDWIRYEWIVVDSGAVASVSLADTATTFPLYLDRDGDGTIDATILPGGVSSAESQPIPGGAERNRMMLRCMPNPSGGDVTIALQSGSTHRSVRVAIYDVAGREVRGIDVGDLPPGIRQLVWDRLDDGGRAVPSGIYHCVASIDGGGRTARRLVVLR